MLTFAPITADKSSRQPRANCAPTQPRGLDEGGTRAERQVHKDMDQTAGRTSSTSFAMTTAHACMHGRMTGRLK